MESAIVASDKGSTTLLVGAQRVSVSDCGGQNHVETHGRASYYNGRASHYICVGIKFVESYSNDIWRFQFPEKFLL